MPTLTFDPTDNQPTSEQMEAEAAALAQGEKLQEAFDQDRARRYEQTDQENSEVNLIGGKFKSQEDLLRAYEELQKKLGSKTPEDEEDASEGPVEASESYSDEDNQEEETTDSSEAVKYMESLGEEYAKTGTLSPEAIERLSQMDQKDLIKSYLEYYQKSSIQAQQAQLKADQINSIKESVGGEKAYGEMTAWAAQNLSQEEISDFNAITNSGNAAAIKFAVEAMFNRYRSSEGFEAPLVTGKKASSGVKPYRSQAELARDIANPLYHSDPAFRSDVEQRLSVSKDLL